MILTITVVRHRVTIGEVVERGWRGKTTTFCMSEIDEMEKINRQVFFLIGGAKFFYKD